MEQLGEARISTVAGKAHSSEVHLQAKSEAKTRYQQVALTHPIPCVNGCDSPSSSGLLYSTRLPIRKGAPKPLMKRGRIRLWTADRIRGRTGFLSISKHSEGGSPLTFPGGVIKTGRLVPPRQAGSGETFNSSYSSKECACGKWICTLTAVTSIQAHDEIIVSPGNPTGSMTEKFWSSRQTEVPNFPLVKTRTVAQE
eukprot:6638316-Heterocapsa_arctica.AAC.1